VWSSCDAASAVAAKSTLEKYNKTHTIMVMNDPVAEEDPDNQLFLKDVGNWLSIEIKLWSIPCFRMAAR